MPNPTNNSPAVWTIGTVLDWTIESFTRSEIESARADAEILLSHAIGCRRFDLTLRRNEPLNELQLKRFRAYIESRRTRVPVAYILGSREFMGLSFAVTADTLVPRPETEHLVEAAIAYVGRTPVSVAMDVCTGSGAIAVALARLSNVGTVYASDISAQALQVAHRNIAAHGAQGRVLLRCGDMFNAFAADALDGTVQLLLSNPPYIPANEYEDLAPELKHEPRQALVCGDNGLQMYRSIARNAPRYLADSAALLIELNAVQSAQIAKIFTDAGYQVAEIIKDYAGHDRVLHMQWRRRNG